MSKKDRDNVNDVLSKLKSKDYVGALENFLKMKQMHGM